MAKLSVAIAGALIILRMIARMITARGAVLAHRRNAAIVAVKTILRKVARMTMVRGAVLGQRLSAATAVVKNMRLAIARMTMVLGGELEAKRRAAIAGAITMRRVIVLMTMVRGEALAQKQNVATAAVGNMRPETAPMIRRDYLVGMVIPMPEFATESQQKQGIHLKHAKVIPRPGTPVGAAVFLGLLGQSLSWWSLVQH